VVFGFFINRNLYLNPKLSMSLYLSGGLLDVKRLSARLKGRVFCGSCGDVWKYLPLQLSGYRECRLMRYNWGLVEEREAKKRE
jgi:hypothetical protein